MKAAAKRGSAGGAGRKASSRQRTSRTKALVPARGGFPLSPFGLVREPFSGAWQRNMTCNDPSLYSFGAVYACVSIISSDTAKLGLYLYRDENGTNVPIPNHPVTALLRRPNDYQTQFEFIQQLMISTLSTGNAYVLKRRDARGVPNALYILNPRQVLPVVSETGDIFYTLQGDLRLAGIREGNAQTSVPASEVIHHRINPLGHPLCGSSPIIAAVASTDGGLSILNNSAAFFKNQSRPSGVLKAPGKVSENAATQFKRAWSENYGGQNTGQIAVLAEGLSFEPITMSAVDAQLIEQLRWSVEDVARVFRVPLFMIGEMSKGVNYRNSEQQARSYYSGCLQAHLESLEARLREGLELANDIVVEFDLDNLLRTEIDVRYDAYGKGINAGFLTINDVRKREGYPSVGSGGDEPLVQAQYRPLSQTVAEAEAAIELAKNPPPPPALPAPTVPGPGDEEDEDEEDVARGLAAAVTRELEERYGIAA